MSEFKSFWVVEFFRNNEWVRAYPRLHDNVDDATQVYIISKKSVENMKGVTDIRIAEYRGWYFVEPHTTIP